MIHFIRSVLDLIDICDAKIVSRAGQKFLSENTHEQIWKHIHKQKATKPMKTNVNINGQTVEITLTEEQVRQLSDSVKPNNKRRRVGHGEEYWVVDSRDVTSYDEIGDAIDDSYYFQGNYFRTKEEAEAELNRRIKKQAILDRIAYLNGNWFPNWSCEDQNWSLYKDNFNDGSFGCTDLRGFQFLPSSHYIKSQDAAEQIIKEFGEDLKYLFE